MHVGIIMDGNRRYAKKNFLSVALGHQGGFQALNKIVDYCPKYGIDTLTVYALSTENITKRSSEEVSNIFKILIEGARKLKRKLIGEGVRVKFLGRMHNLPDEVVEALNNLMEATKDCSKGLLQVCFNYGGRLEILEAVQLAIEAGEKKITEEIVNKYLYSPLEPDLIIRPGGEFRLSNFMTWQSVYSELYFTDKLWPEFKEQDLKDAVDFYNSRQRRLGK
jgi:undecaprenyl diphosphate synthase